MHYVPLVHDIFTYVADKTFLLAYAKLLVFVVELEQVCNQCCSHCWSFGHGIDSNMSLQNYHVYDIDSTSCSFDRSNNEKAYRD